MTQVSRSQDADGERRPSTSDGKKDNIWSSMLDGVASGRRMPEKNLLVLGGSPESQRAFMESLADDFLDSDEGHVRSAAKAVTISNRFALGYAYHDVLDADQEDTLARLSLHLLSDPSPDYAPLLRPLLTPQTIPNTLLVILLDWTQPWAWLRQLRRWIQLLRSLLTSLDVESKDAMEEVMIHWRDRRRGNTTDGEPGVAVEGEVSLPLGPGEWDEALGLPLCVVCQNASHLDILEKERGWREEEFDFVLQFIRTILLKHGSSLVYTSPSAPNSLPHLIHSSLGIQSFLKRQSLKHNVVDRAKILIPPNWDSWGKIRVLREGFDVEGVSTGWSAEIERLAQSKEGLQGAGEGATVKQAGASAIYEEAIRDPQGDYVEESDLIDEIPTPPIEVECPSTQEFLTSQIEVLEKLRLEDEQRKLAEDDGSKDGSARPPSHSTGPDRRALTAEEGRGVNEHIGPVQFNVGGIQVDADDMLKRIKERESLRTPEPQASTPTAVASPEGKSQNEALASFFAGLMKRGGSAANSPRAG